MLYGYAKFNGYDAGFFRAGGTGLGNLLFPWARLTVAARDHDLVPVAPTWGQLKPGPFLRKEKDKRAYFDLFNHDHENISGWKKFFLLCGPLPKEHEKGLYNGSIINDGRDRVVVFEGMEGYFHRILREHEYIKKELLKMTKGKHKTGLDFDFKRSISVHVRLTDFTLPSDKTKLADGHPNLRVPVSWYVDILTRLRSLIGTDTPIYVFSDGTDNELSGLLRIPNSHRLSFGSGIADLLALSRSKILVASGSTFSMWASYLGRMPVVWHKGQLKQKLYYENEDSEIQCAEGGLFPPGFCALIKDSFRENSSSVA